MPTPQGKRLALLVATFVVVILAVATWFSWPHLRFWWLFEPMGVNGQGLPEYRHRQTGIVMVRVPGGTFWMGAQEEDPRGQNYDPEATPEERPVHEVTLSPFLIAKYEVTQGHWRRVMGTSPSYSGGADHPVEAVSWDDCQDFCRKTGLKLPTEAQWEYACRGNSLGPYAGTGKLEDIGWFEANSRDMPNPVGRKRPNRFGLHDMQGNVFEWCEDLWDFGFYSMPEAAGKDPVCTFGSAFRVLRGGAFYSHRGDLRCAARSGGGPDGRGIDFGFRVVASPF